MLKENKQNPKMALIIKPVIPSFERRIEKGKDKINNSIYETGYFQYLIKVILALVTMLSQGPVFWNNSNW